MKFKNRILKFTSKSNLTIDLDFIDGQELMPNLETDYIGRFFYSTDPAWGINSDKDWYAESRKRQMLTFVKDFDLYRNKEVKTYGELIGPKQDSYEPFGLKIGSTGLYFADNNIRSFSGFKQFLHTKVEETKNGIKSTRSTYWELLVDLAERNIFIRFPVKIKVESEERLGHNELNIDIYIKFPTENKLKLYLVEKNIN
jgi:hypothetical protein